MSSEKKINVAIIGVGNCASSLVQGTEFYQRVTSHEGYMAGLAHPLLAGFMPTDLRFVLGFDVDNDKIGKPISEAIFCGQNNSARMVEEVMQPTGLVHAGPLIDGLGEKYKESIDFRKDGYESVSYYSKMLKKAGVDVLVNYLPVGSEIATQFWASVALHASVGFVNCIPSFIASNSKWAERFRDQGVPIIGDDIKSQIGATILNRQMVRLCKMRGVSVDKVYQLNFGGNMDFKNMLDTDRLGSKKVSKSNAVFAEMEEGDEANNYRNTHISPSDFVPWLEDRKWAYIRIEGRQFGGVPYSMETKLEVHDSPNSAGIVIDCIRLVKHALDEGRGGPLQAESAFYMKSPFVQISDEVSYKAIERYIWENPKA